MEGPSAKIIRVDFGRRASSEVGLAHDPSALPSFEVERETSADLHAPVRDESKSESGIAANEQHLRHRDPTSDTYSEAEVLRLLSLPRRTLRKWTRDGIVSAEQGRYSFRDLISLRVAQGLFGKGISQRAVEQAIFALKRSLPNVTKPLSELKLFADGQKVVVRDEHGSYEPSSGQRVLELSVGELEQTVVAVLRPHESDPSHKRRAYEQYLEGCRWEESPDTVSAAMDAYRRAIALNPTLFHAYINLANLLAEDGDIVEAEALYHRVAELCPTQPEAHYNLGYLAFGRGDMDEACHRFQAALQIDPSYADAYFNLAMCLLEQGKESDARKHFARYLDFSPDGSWAEIARMHIA